MRRLGPWLGAAAAIVADQAHDPASSPATDGLRTVYSQEGFRGLYKGSLLALVGVTNGSIQFAAYEEIKRRRSDLKRARIEGAGGTWRTEDEMLVRTAAEAVTCHVAKLTHSRRARPIPSTSSRAA